jgi:hypothetical protein
MAELQDPDLAELLAAARAASRTERINYRDAIAASGVPAIDAIAPWIEEPEFAAFAVRVIAKVGAAGPRDAAIAALLSASEDVSQQVRRDIDDALARLGGRRPPAPSSVQPKAPPPINDSLYERLVDAARARRTMTYSDAGEIIGLSMRNPHHRRLLGQVLGAISEYETQRARPMLSAVVIHKGEKSLGSGFYQLGEEIGLKGSGEDEESFAVRELNRVFTYWSRPTPPDPAPTLTGAPDFRSHYPPDGPPAPRGDCGFSTPVGRCQNPGRWDRDGHLCCSPHALAREPVPWEPASIR